MLGTASQAPTRHRNHNGYFLRWDAEGLLFDPGEGTQRQLTLAGVAASAITRICITHLHGDHCLGLPGVLQRLSLDRVTHPVVVHHPASGAPFLERLRYASIYDEQADVRLEPVDAPATIAVGPAFSLQARRLDHRVDAIGYRLEEPDGRRMLPERLAARGVRGADVGRLQREGLIVIDGRRVELDEVSELRPGQRFAFIMDTRVCDAAYELAADADLVVCESTFLDAERDLAEAYGHLTAAQAATIAADAGARFLVLAHFSARHPDEADYLAEAAPIFPDVVVARDLERIAVPPRR